MSITQLPTFVQIALLGLAISLLISFFKYFARYSQLQANELLSNTMRAPVLLLRSFIRDNKWISRSRNIPFPLKLFFLAPVTYEEKLVEILELLGPVVAIGSPEETVQPLGASRAYTNDEEWKSEVLTYAKSSCLIVIIIDNTPGVRWELENIAKLNQFGKLLLIFPPLKERQFLNESYDIVEMKLWYEMYEELRIEFDFLPQVSENAIGVKFDSNEIPSLIYSKSSMAIEQLYVIKQIVLDKVYNMDELMLQSSNIVDNENIDATRLLEVIPDNSEDWSKKGIVYENLGRIEDAFDAYNKSIEINPKNYISWNNVGVIFVNLKRFEEALDAYNKSLEINPDNYIAWNNKGVVLLILRQYWDALETSKRALEINSCDHIVWKTMGIALLNLGRYEDALDTYNKSIEIEPDDYVVWKSKGTALLNIGRLEEALDAYDKCITLKNDDYKNLEIFWPTIFAEKQHDDGAKFPNKAIGIKNGDYVLLRNKGIALLNLGRYEDAVEAFNEAIGINSFDHKAWKNKGEALLNLGRTEKATEALNKAQEIKPDNLM